MRRWGGDGDGDSSLVCGGGVKLIVIMTLRHPLLNTEAAFFSWGKIFMRDCLEGSIILKSKIPNITLILIIYRI